MAEKAKLPRGIENFSRIHKEGFYYVDKTGLIRDFKKKSSICEPVHTPKTFFRIVAWAVSATLIPQFTTSLSRSSSLPNSSAK